MKNVTEAAPKIFMIESPIVMARCTCIAYIIKGSSVVLIDPGPGSNIPLLREAMDSLAISKPDYIIATHLHIDHSGSVGTLSRLYPDAKVVVHPRYARHAIDPSRMVSAFKIVWGNDFESLYGAVEPVPENRLLLPADGEVVNAGDRELEFIHTPGHAPHHMAIYERRSRGLFGGDAVGLADFQLPSAPPMSFDLEPYVESLEKLRKLRPVPEILFLAHGAPVRDAAAALKRGVETTHLCTELILEGMREGESDEQLEMRVADGIMRRYGVRISQDGAWATVAGLSLYFRTKGIGKSGGGS
jgi:glyoxylase-like metal-dependent hydrolase (beta-lactamase superfamily II)